MTEKARAARPGDAPADAMPMTPAPGRRGYIPRGRTVQLGGRQHGPGTLLEDLSVEEHAHLSSTGFLQSEPPNLEPPPAHNPGQVGFQNAGIIQGPVYE